MSTHIKIVEEGKCYVEDVAITKTSLLFTSECYSRKQSLQEAVCCNDRHWKLGIPVAGVVWTSLV